MISNKRCRQTDIRELVSQAFPYFHEEIRENLVWLIV